MEWFVASLVILVLLAFHRQLLMAFRLVLAAAILFLLVLFAKLIIFGH